VTGSGRPDPAIGSLWAVLAELATRGEVALRLESPGLDRLLRSIVDATVTLFEAEAASIALVESDRRLRFRVAAGPHGDGVVGLTVEAGEGVAGFVLASAQAIAISNLADDPRFDRDAAARTGYVPRSMLAAPLESDDGVIGVLEVLDRRDGGAFDLSDLERASVFARQAATAIEVSRVERDVVRLVASGLASLAAAAGAGSPTRLGVPPDRAWESIAADVARSVDRDDDRGFWTLVDRLARLRVLEGARLALVSDMLEAALGHVAPPQPSAGLPLDRQPTWRDRAGLDDS
jgi:signal transduction protein with GAF and PtsI domain